MFDGVADFVGMGDFTLDEVETGQYPVSELRLGQVIEDSPPIAPFGDQVMGAHDREMLGNAGVGDPYGGLEAIDIDLAVSQLLDNANAVGIGENTKEVCQLFTDGGTCWHVNLFEFYEIRKFPARKNFASHM